MVGVGVLMLLTAWSGVYLFRKNTNYIPDGYAKVLYAMTFSGWFATIAGWYVTEIGRQPWLVQGVLTTADAANPVSQKLLVTSLTMYLTMYIFLLIAFVGTVFYMARKQRNNDNDIPLSSSGEAVVDVISN